MVSENDCHVPPSWIWAFSISDFKFGIGAPKTVAVPNLDQIRWSTASIMNFVEKIDGLCVRFNTFGTWKSGKIRENRSISTQNTSKTVLKKVGSMLLTVPERVNVNHIYPNHRSEVYWMQVLVGHKICFIYSKIQRTFSHTTFFFTGNWVMEKMFFHSPISRSFQETSTAAFPTHLGQVSWMENQENFEPEWGIPLFLFISNLCNFNKEMNISNRA